MRLWDRYGRAFLLAGLAAGLVLGLRASAGRIGALDDGALPSSWGLLVVVVLLLAGQLSVGYGWRRLAPQLRQPVVSMWTFHATQPGKYLPLGVGQALGQVALARGLGMPARAAMGAWASHLAMIVAAGTATGVLLVLQPGAGAIRWSAPLCLGGLGFVYRPVLQRLVGFGSRFSRRLPAAGDIPSQRALVEAFTACVAFVVLQGSAFAVLLGADGLLGWLAVVGGYALAVGISTATPLPAGLGGRELLLVLVLTASASSTVSASIVQRVTIFAIEVALLLAFTAARRVPFRGAVREAAAGGSIRPSSPRRSSGTGRTSS